MVTKPAIQVSNVWKNASFSKPRNRVLLAEEQGDMLIALNCYSPGDMNELHYHLGAGQSFLILKGPVTLRHRHKDTPEEQTDEVQLNEGDCVLIPADVYYQMYNPGPHEVLLYQAKPSVEGGDQIAVQGKGVLNTRDYFTDALKNTKDIVS